MNDFALEIGSTVLAVVVFVAIIVLSGILGVQKVGGLVAITVFVLLLGGAGYLVAEKTYE